MRLAALACLLSCSPALAGGAGGPPGLRPAPPVQPGQVWRLEGVTADGEQFQTALRLSAQAPAARPLTYRADRGVLLLDPAVPSLVAVDTGDASRGGLALACVTIGTVTAGAALSGVLVSGTPEQVSARLEEAFAVASLARSPADLMAAAADVGLGSCTLTLN